MTEYRTEPLDHASAEVAEAIHAVMKDAYGIEAGILGVADFPPLRRTAADIAGSGTGFVGIRLNGALVAVAELDDTATGGCQICSLVVSPARFRSGLATALLRDVVRFRPACEITVSTGVRNGPALQLYAAAGFCEQERWSTPDGIPMVTFVHAGVPVIRPTTSDDLGAILELNTVWERVTSPLDAAALADLHAQAAYHRVIELDGRIAAFLLAIGPGRPYESANYRWFDARSNDFLYIDRVIVSSDFHRKGLAAALYDDVRAFAVARGISRLVCEVDVEPLNVASDEFHRQRGFVEVGTQWVAGGTKRVSLRESVIGRPKLGNATGEQDR